MSKKIVLSLIILLAFIFSGIAYAADNPFQGLTKEQVIQKYFEGRQLDLIEGIWLNHVMKPIIIIKANLINASNNDNYDYLVVEYSSSSSTKVVGVRKTEYSSCFKWGKSDTLFRFVSQTTLQRWDGFPPYTSVPIYEYYTRIYPTEIK